MTKVTIVTSVVTELMDVTMELMMLMEVTVLI